MIPEGAALTQPQQLEKRVREHAGDIESAWSGAGSIPGLQIWRIEQFNIVPWPKEWFGNFYDGDSYIVLHVSFPSFPYVPIMILITINAETDI